MNNKFYISFTLTFLLFAPALSLPFILYGIYYRKKSAFFFFSIFLGIVAFLTGPTGDVYRWTLTYYGYKFTSYADFWLYIKNSGDFLTQLFSFLLAKNDIPYPFLRLVITITAYNIMFCIFNYYIDRNIYLYTKKDIFLRFIFLVVVSDFFNMLYGVRYVFAVVLLIFAYHNFTIGNKKTAVIAIYIAINTHFSILYYAIALLSLTLLRIKKQKFFIIIFFSFVLGYIGYSFVSYLAHTFNLMGAGYLGEGTWGTGRLEYEANRGITRIASYIYDRLSILLSAILLAYYYWDNKDFHYKFLYGTILLFCIINQFGTASSRQLHIIDHLLFIFLLHNEFKLNMKTNKKIFSIVLNMLSVRFMVQLIGYGNIVSHSGEYMKMLYPITEVLQNDFDINWIIHNVTPEGHIIPK